MSSTASSPISGCDPEQQTAIGEFAVEQDLRAGRPANVGSPNDVAIPPSFWLDETSDRRSWLRANRGSDSALTENDVVRAIALLDGAISRQLDAILHHRDFQKLESSWRGLGLLVTLAAAEDDRTVRVRVLNVSWKALGDDIARASHFDQTEIFHKVYDQEFGMPGGEPFGLLLGDYEVAHKPNAEHPSDDVEVLTGIGQAAAAAFAPFVCSAHPSLLGLESFEQLERQPDIHRHFQNPEFAAWNALRRSEDSKFIGVTVPRVLMRLPHVGTQAVVSRRCCRGCQRELTRRESGECLSCGIAYDVRNPGTYNTKRLGFQYREQATTSAEYLWGSANWAFGAVVIRAFASSGWLANIRGFDRNVEGGGLVVGMPVHSYGLDAPEVAPKMSTDTALDGFQDKCLADHGLIPLTHCHDTDLSVFFSNQSLHVPRTYDTEAATLNARISSQLQYTLCASRFAHYLKVLARDRIGMADAPEQLADRLKYWISDYVTPNAQASPDIKARYPLREAEVDVQEVKEFPGKYVMVMKLWPHYQLDDLRVGLKFVSPVDQKRDHLVRGSGTATN